MTPVMNDSDRTSAIALCCPRCGAELSEGEDALSCSSCGATYPIVNGIPRLVESDFYWGEMEQAQAREFIDVAKESGWKEAVAQRYSPSEDGWISLLDWQRASWIPLLELPKESVVLDIGSGYGAITHALATHFDEVHSIDAIAERVEFTRVRLDQSGCDNVRLIVGSALKLPYPPNSFDAIIVNGVLEWIGDWDLEGAPREAQLRFLRKIFTLLKPGGRLLVGIENRLSYASFRGGIDHSGLPDTNLLPRPLASAALKLFAKQHHRMVAPSRSYRTYTYTARGYRKLFGECGFRKLDSYWAEPGYNQPYRLTPLDDASVASSLTELQTGARPGQLTSMGKLKRAFARAGFFKHFVHDYVFIIRKDGGRETTSWKSLLPAPLRNAQRFLLTTYNFAKKTTIRASANSGDGVVVKCSTPTEDSRARVAAEYAELESIDAIVQDNPGLLPFRVSKPLGSGTFGRQLITAETCACGEQMQLIFSAMSNEERLAFLRAHLPKLMETACSIAKLAPYRARHIAAGSWLRAAETVVDSTLNARARAIGEIYREWMGHGDFTLENCILDSATGDITVIDWEFVRDGVPPLYDLFTLFLSILNCVNPPEEVSAKITERSLAQFYTLFFHRNEFSQLLASATRSACDRLEIDRTRTWRLFEDSILFRVGYLIERKSNVAANRIRFITAMQEWKTDFQL